eukprot:SAG11_NODE_533_length_8703_cov_7.183054_9_plen_153_part_00
MLTAQDLASGYAQLTNSDPRSNCNRSAKCQQGTLDMLTGSDQIIKTKKPELPRHNESSPQPRRQRSATRTSARASMVDHVEMSVTIPPDEQLGFALSKCAHIVVYRCGNNVARPIARLRHIRCAHQRPTSFDRLILFCGMMRCVFACESVCE